MTYVICRGEGQEGTVITTAAAAAAANVAETEANNQQPQATHTAGDILAF